MLIIISNADAFSSVFFANTLWLFHRTALFGRYIGNNTPLIKR